MRPNPHGTPPKASSDNYSMLHYATRRFVPFVPNVKHKQRNAQKPKTITPPSLPPPPPPPIPYPLSLSREQTKQTVLHISTITWRSMTCSNKRDQKSVGTHQQRMDGNDPKSSRLCTSGCAHYARKNKKGPTKHTARGGKKKSHKTRVAGYASFKYACTHAHTRAHAKKKKKKKSTHTHTHPWCTPLPLSANGKKTKQCRTGVTWGYIPNHTSPRSVSSVFRPPRAAFDTSPLRTHPTTDDTPHQNTPHTRRCPRPNNQTTAASQKQRVYARQGIPRTFTRHAQPDEAGAPVDSDALLAAGI